MVSPSDNRWHWEPKPLLGGVAMIAAFVLSLGLFGGQVFKQETVALWLVACAAALFLVGLLDDIKTLSPRVKLALEITAIGLLASWGRKFELINYWPADLLLTVFWLLATTNAVNLVDGIDGLAAGIGLVAALAIAAIAGLNHRPFLLIEALTLAGALAGFLVYNFHPAAIFMGDAGALSLGLILGVLSVHAGQVGQGSRLSQLAVPLLLMMVPLLDTLTVMVTRAATGNPVSRRGLDHCHHRLARLGLSDRYVVAVLCVLGGAAGVCAVAMTLLPALTLMLMLPFPVLLFALVALFLMDRTFEPVTPAEMAQLPWIGRVIVSFGYKRRIVEAVLDIVLIAGAYFGAIVLRTDFNPSPGLALAVISSLPWVALVTFAAFVATGVYRGIWRYASLEDAFRFAFASALADLLTFAASRVLPIVLSGSIVVLFPLLLFNLLVATRLSFRAFNRAAGMLARPLRRVIVIGAGAAAETAARHLIADTKEQTVLVGFVDGDEFKRGKRIHGYPVIGAVSELPRIFSNSAFHQILVATEAISQADLDSVQAFARAHELELHRFSVDLNPLVS